MNTMVVYDSQYGNTERIAQGSYGVADARVVYETVGKRGFGASAWIKNIANDITARMLAHAKSRRYL